VKFKKIWNMITLLVLLIGFSMIAEQWLQWNNSYNNSEYGNPYGQITNGIYVVYFVFGLAFIGMFIEGDYSLVKKES